MKKRIEELVNIINKANHEYYILEKPILSDKQYDDYLKELEMLEKKYPECVSIESPTKKINVTLNTPFSKVNHQTPMLSLSNVFDFEQLRQFDERIKKTISKFSYVCELKIDGLAVSLAYKDGKLEKAATRGDGLIGEDITNNVKKINSIPLLLSEKIDFEVRGEIFMNKLAFKKLNEIRQKNGENLFANPRNAASGSIRQLDENVTAERKLACFIYYGDIEEIKSHYQTLNHLKKLGFMVSPSIKKANNIEEAISYIEEWDQKRESLAYETDGVVIKIDDKSNQKKLGETFKSPKWAIAYKFKPIEEITKIKDIIFTVGRTGQITPNAVLEAILIDGSLVSRTTLHNEKNVIEKDIRIGDYVVVRKAGDIIPEVVKVVFEKRTEKLLKFKMTEKCPICHFKLSKKEDEAAHFCLNLKCEARIQESLVHYCSRGAQNIEGLGDKIIEIFYNEGLLKSIKDIYLLKNFRDKIINLSGFGEKRIDYILENIEKSKNNNLDKLIFGLGIKHVGSKTAKILAEEAKDLNVLKKKTKEELVSINEIGEKIADSVVDYFNDFKNIELLNFLEKEKLNFKYISNKKENVVFLNKTFVITGSFENLKREQIKENIEKYGGNVTSTVTNKTDILICGENPGSKLKEALKHKITIWNKEQLDKNLV